MASMDNVVDKLICAASRSAALPHSLAEVLATAGSEQVQPSRAADRRRASPWHTIDHEHP
jgi:hypothetical protein